MPTLKIAIQGCCHGELNKIYSTLPSQTELLLIGGDFQSIRTPTDLSTLNVPNKYKKLGDFPDYYHGKKLAPVLTIFIGGNHECSSYLQELKYGGWVAPNIYYLGEFGSVWYKGIQICGWSGIFNYSTFMKNDLYVEKVPYDNWSIRSVYHQKLNNFVKMYMMNHDLDVVLSHDWPIGIEVYGNKAGLLKRKPFFREDIEKGELGSPLNKFLLHYLRPRFWYSAHLHTKFEAIVEYKQENDSGKKGDVKNKEAIELDMDEPETTTKNAAEISLDMDDELPISKNRDELSLDMDDEGPSTSENEIPLDIDQSQAKQFEQTLHVSPIRPPQQTSKRLSTTTTTTQFLALDKCGRARHHITSREIEIVHTDHPSYKNPGKLYYSKRSIAINKTVENYLSSHSMNFKSINTRKIIQDPYNLVLVNELLPLVNLELNKLNKLPEEDFIIPENFQKVDNIDKNKEVRYYPNNQTQEYCDRFQIPFPGVFTP
ncbi:DBR1 [[Candida] subhashii]|uniref:DBR1 n=1 Tax=[Candida] subhashii TaxID=561895 RepID=A0A8J5UNV1_9ASCO|nr:DBR1 [[Candida] subhashii]KAG7663901.1 DBR1 [[Candida] subhashii]